MSGQVKELIVRNNSNYELKEHFSADSVIEYNISNNTVIKKKNQTKITAKMSLKAHDTVLFEIVLFQ